MFLLDTDTCIFALRGHTRVLERIMAHRRADVTVSVVTEAELRTGAAKSSSPSKAARSVERFLAPLRLMAFESSDAAAYARIRAALERSGSPIGPLDTLIAAQAVARRLTLVSNNAREFGRIPTLRLESWTR